MPQFARAVLSLRHLRVTALAGAISATAAFALAAPPTSNAQTSPTATSCAKPVATLAMSSRSQSPCWRPFLPSAPVNTLLPANPQLAPNHAAVQQHMARYGWSLQGYAGYSGFSLSSRDGDRPVYFAAPSDPVMTVHCTDEEGPNTCQGSNHINVNGARINVPAGAKPTPNWDAHMIIVEAATGVEYDFWHASVSGSTLTAGTGTEENVNTTDGTRDGGDAASLALTAGLLRPSELASGRIDHALVLTVPCTNATGSNAGYVWPAAGGWGQYCGQFWNESTSGAPNVGQLFKLNMTAAEIAASGAPTWERTIMTALSQYGAYIEDTNGSWRDERMHIMTEDPTSWTSLGLPNQWTSVINQLGGSNNLLSSKVAIPISRLEVVDPCVPEGACPSNASAKVAYARHPLTRAQRARRRRRLHTTRRRRRPLAYGGPSRPRRVDSLRTVSSAL